MKISNVLIFIFLPVLMGCQSRRSRLRGQNFKHGKQAKKQLKQHHVALQKFKLKLAGIECRYCARTALELLEAVPGVISAEFITNDFTHIDGFAYIYYQPAAEPSHNLNSRGLFQQLEQVLAAEYFKLISLEQILPDWIYQ